MSYTIGLSDDHKYIVIKVKGEMTSKLAMQQNVEAHALGTRLGIHLYLVDVTEARNVDTAVSTYNFANEDMHEEPVIDVHARVAMLVSPEDHSHDFVETTSRNAGLDVTLFRDRKLAIRHLLG